MASDNPQQSRITHWPLHLLADPPLNMQALFSLHGGWMNDELQHLRRLPDQPHKVARGVFAGSLVGFLPLPGLQFIAAWLARL